MTKPISERLREIPCEGVPRPMILEEAALQIDELVEALGKANLYVTYIGENHKAPIAKKLSTVNESILAKHGKGK